MKGRILLLVIPFLFSCGGNKSGSSEPKIPRHSYEEVKDKTINWLDTFLKPEEDYCVYFFSRTCMFCEEIRDEVIEISLTHAMPIYFCNDNAIVTYQYLDPETTLGMNDINEFKIKGFPSIIEVEYHHVKSHCPGKRATLDFIRSIP